MVLQAFKLRHETIGGISSVVELYRLLRVKVQIVPKGNDILGHL